MDSKLANTIVDLLIGEKVTKHENEMMDEDFKDMDVITKQGRYIRVMKDIQILCGTEQKSTITRGMDIIYNDMLANLDLGLSKVDVDLKQYEKMKDFIDCLKNARVGKNIEDFDKNDAIKFYANLNAHAHGQHIRFLTENIYLPDNDDQALLCQTVAKKLAKITSYVGDVFNLKCLRSFACDLHGCAHNCEIKKQCPRCKFTFPRVSPHCSCYCGNCKGLDYCDDCIRRPIGCDCYQVQTDHFCKHEQEQMKMQKEKLNDLNIQREEHNCDKEGCDEMTTMFSNIDIKE